MSYGLKGLNFGLGTGSSIDIDVNAAALIAVMEIHGQAPSAGRKALIIDTIENLKSAGLLSALDFLHIYAAHGDKAALINWVDPSKHLGIWKTDVGDPDAYNFTADEGFNAAGRRWLDARFNPFTDAVNYVLNSACFGVWCFNTPSVNSPVSGIITAGGSKVAITPVGTDSDAWATLNNSDTTTFETDGTGGPIGMHVIDRPDASNINYYKNGSALTRVFSDLMASSTMPNDITHFPYEPDDTASQAHVTSMMFAGRSLTAQEHSDLYTILSGYMTSL